MNFRLRYINNSPGLHAIPCHCTTQYINIKLKVIHLRGGGWGEIIL